VLKADVRLVVVAGDIARDALSCADAGPVTRRDLKPGRVNNNLRAGIRAALGALELARAAMLLSTSEAVPNGGPRRCGRGCRWARPCGW
jgi:hypothetical protein